MTVRQSATSFISHLLYDGRQALVAGCLVAVVGNEFLVLIVLVLRLVVFGNLGQLVGLTLLVVGLVGLLGHVGLVWCGFCCPSAAGCPLPSLGLPLGMSSHCRSPAVAGVKLATVGHGGCRAMLWVLRLGSIVDGVELQALPGSHQHEPLLAASCPIASTRATRRHIVHCGHVDSGQERFLGPLVPVAKRHDLLVDLSADVLVLVQVAALEVDGTGLQRPTQGGEDVLDALLMVDLIEAHELQFLLRLSCERDVQRHGTPALALHVHFPLVVVKGASRWCPAW